MSVWRFPSQHNIDYETVVNSLFVIDRELGKLSRDLNLDPNDTRLLCIQEHLYSAIKIVGTWDAFEWEDAREAYKKRIGL